MVSIQKREKFCITAVLCDFYTGNRPLGRVKLKDFFQIVSCTDPGLERTSDTFKTGRVAITFRIDFHSPESPVIYFYFLQKCLYFPLARNVVKASAEGVWQVPVREAGYRIFYPPTAAALPQDRR